MVNYCSVSESDFKALDPTLKCVPPGVLKSISPEWTPPFREIYLERQRDGRKANLTDWTVWFVNFCSHISTFKDSLWLNLFWNNQVHASNDLIRTNFCADKFSCTSSIFAHLLNRNISRVLISRTLRTNLFLKPMIKQCFYSFFFNTKLENFHLDKFSHTCLKRSTNKVSEKHISNFPLFTSG